MPLYHKAIDSTEIFATLTTLASLHLCENEIIVAVRHDIRNDDSFLNINLVIMSVNSEALHSILLCNFEAGIVVVEYQVDILGGLLGRACLMMVLRR